MSVHDTDIDKLCALAQLGIDPADRDRTRADLERVLGMIDAIAAIDTTGIAPLAHPLDATQRLRADVVTETVNRDTFQALAPRARDGLYLVPRVIEA
jgi:aspartyl-tRNA(Asn)/glutamyl-tRNA(Gln) amidotransferase subunit C